MSYPSGYFELRMNSQYIVSGGKATSLDGLAGTRDGCMFYPLRDNPNQNGYLIRMRVPTCGEQLKTVKADSATKLDISDWK